MNPSRALSLDLPMMFEILEIEKGNPAMAATGLDHLPDDTIDDILARLPTRDAVRTSVLCRSWRHRWKKIPDLDLSSLTAAAVDKTLRLHSAPVRHLKIQFETRPKLVPLTLVPSLYALACRSSVSLRTIDLSSCPSNFRLSTFALSCPRLTLIKLSACIVNKLNCTSTTIFPDLRTLDIDSVTFIHNHADLDSDGYLSIPMYIPQCPKLEKLTLYPDDHNPLVHLDSISRYLDSIGRHFPGLNHFELGYCDLNIEPAALASLRVLHLSSVGVYGKLSVLFSSCPSLETLIMKDVSLVEEEHLHVSAPNLRVLELADVGGVFIRLRDISIANSPFLETVLLDLKHANGSDEEVDETCNLLKVLGGLPRVKKLTLRGEMVEVRRR